MWVAAVSGPGITNALRDVAKHMHAANEEHWKAVLRTFRYLKETSAYGATYKGMGDEHLHVFADSEFTPDPNDRRSIFGGAVIFGVATCSGLPGPKLV